MRFWRVHYRHSAHKHKPLSTATMALLAVAYFVGRMTRSWDVRKHRDPKTIMLGLEVSPDLRFFFIGHQSGALYFLGVNP